MANSQKKNSIGGTIIVILIVAAFIVGLYMTLTRGKRDQSKLEPNVNVSEASTLITRDMNSNYPATAREVMKYYCRITQCLYSDELSDSEIEKLIDKIRCLYSEELLAENDRDEMIGLARGEIKHYQSNKMKINSYSVPEAGEIVYDRISVPNRCSMDIYFTTKCDNYFERAYETFYLYEDEAGKWKILGWKATEE